MGISGLFRRKNSGRERDNEPDDFEPYDDNSNYDEPGDGRYYDDGPDPRESNRENRERSGKTEPAYACPYTEIALILSGHDDVAKKISRRIHEGETIIIGRSDFKLPTSTSEIPMRISREHFSIRKRGKEYHVSDLNSVNGTWLNGVRLQPNMTYLLYVGDTLRLGGVDYIFSVPGGSFRPNDDSI